MSRLLLVITFAACVTPSALGADAARNADATQSPREPAARVLMPASPLLDDAVAAAPVPETPHQHEATIDPVCGMKVKPESAGGGSVTQHGHTYFFCSNTCRTTFLARDGGAP